MSRVSGCQEAFQDRHLRKERDENPTTCMNCQEDIDVLDRPNILQKLWNSYFLCDDCGRMARITALIVTILMAALGWFV